MKGFMIFNLVFHLAQSQHHSMPAEAIAAVNLDGLFQHSTSRNHKVITQAIDLISSMQTAPTCTRMAASHLMNECKLLEHAPDFAKSRPEAYLDSVKTEYAAKLAVCELMSAQPNRPSPPPNCEILVPSAKACGIGGAWWYSQSEPKGDQKQCYPELKAKHYHQCLWTLQSTPQYWTSFSNARQNAVVMCQASRDAIERENHLDTFKNLTQVIAVMSAALGNSARSYKAWSQEQNQFSDTIRQALDQIREDVDAIQEKALATMGTLDDKFREFAEISIIQLMKALAENQSKEIVRIRREMQTFSKELIVESSQIADHVNAHLHAYHERTLTNLQANHEAQMSSYDGLRVRLAGMHTTAAQIDAITGSTLNKVITIEQQFQDLASQTDHIVQGVAFLKVLPNTLLYFLKWLSAICGIVFLLQVCLKVNKHIAIYTGCVCSSAILLHFAGYNQWSAPTNNFKAGNVTEPLPHVISIFSSKQRAVAMFLLLWICAYPIGRINGYLGSILSTFIDRTTSYWIQQYTNENGAGLLPSIEVPPTGNIRGVFQHHTNPGLLRSSTCKRDRPDGLNRRI